MKFSRCNQFKTDYNKDYAIYYTTTLLIRTRSFKDFQNLLVCFNIANAIGLFVLYNMKKIMNAVIRFTPAYFTAA